MELKKINKSKARRLYNEGKTLYLVPCKVYPNFGGGFVVPYELHKDRFDDNFDRTINSYQYYNCNNELGKYTHFYVEVEC